MLVADLVAESILLGAHERRFYEFMLAVRDAQ